MTDCDCPNVSDRVKHTRWHELVAEQTGITSGPVNFETLKAARGYSTPTVSGETILDVRARASGKRASGAMRRASR